MKRSGRSVRQIHSLLRSSLDPASQRGVTRSHTAPDAVSRKSSGRRARKIHSLLRPSLDPASQRRVTCSHTAPRCGIHEKIRQECPPNPFPFTFLSGPRVAARGDSQSYRTRCGIQEKLGQESPQDPFPFASLSGPRVAARGDVLVIPHLDAVSTRYAVRRVEIERVADRPRRTNRGRKWKIRKKSVYLSSLNI